MTHQKVCPKCKESKLLSQFYKNKNTKDGLKCDCKDCNNIRTKKYLKTIPGLITHIYKDQRSNSKKRNMDLPNYSKTEFKNWILKQPNFDALFKSWVGSGYEKGLKPSVDRIDDYKPYTMSNIRLITWKENNSKYYKDAKAGVNKKALKAVISYNKNNEETTEYYSAAEAARQTGLIRGSITQCCRGKLKTTGGFNWEYKDKN